jgi:hypothetical protein
VGFVVLEILVASETGKMVERRCTKRTGAEYHDMNEGQRERLVDTKMLRDVYGIYVNGTSIPPASPIPSCATAPWYEQFV